MPTPETPDNPEKTELQKSADYFKRHRLMKAWFELNLKIGMYGLALMTGQLKDLRDPAKNRDLVEGAIIGNPLGHLAPESKDFVYERASGGIWLGWDANRRKEFPLTKIPDSQLLHKGKVRFLLPEEFRDNDADEKTPIGAVNYFNLDHILTFDMASPQKLGELGLLKQVSYEEAYSNLDLLADYGDELRSRGMVDDPVWQVTPKGNTLVSILPARGSASPKKEPQTEFAKAPGFMPGIA